MIRAFLASLLLLLAPVAASAQTLLFSPNSLPLSGSCGTVTASSPCIDLTQTWNNAGITFYGFRLNVTDTASASASLLMDLQVGASSRFSVDKNATLSLGGAVSGGLGVKSSTNENRLYFSANGNRLSVGSLGTISWNSGTAADGTPDVILARDAANTLALRNGVNAQRFNIYNTYTDASNYELGFLAFSSNNFIIGAGSAGTGTARPIVFQTTGTNRWQIDTSGNFTAVTDNAFDIGASGATRPRNEFLSGYLITQVTTVSGLTACASGLKGARSFVTDANATTFLSTVAGGGANNVPVVCDGTNWKIG